jgi:hypothetical protein
MVSVRSRNGMVTDVSASTLPPDRLHAGLESPQHLLTLSSVENDGMMNAITVAQFHPLYPSWSVR